MGDNTGQFSEGLHRRILKVFIPTSKEEEFLSLTPHPQHRPLSDSLQTGSIQSNKKKRTQPSGFTRPSVANPGGTFCCGEELRVPQRSSSSHPSARGCGTDREQRCCAWGRGFRSGASRVVKLLWAGVDWAQETQVSLLPACHLEGDSDRRPAAAPPRAQRPQPDPREHLLQAGSQEAASTCDGHPQGEETTSAHLGFPQRGSDRTSWVWGPGFSCSGLCPRWRGRRQHIGAAPGSAAPAGQAGVGGGQLGANLSQGADPYVESVGQPRARQLKDARFHHRSIIPQAAPGSGARRTDACSLLTDRLIWKLPSGLWAGLGRLWTPRGTLPSPPHAPPPWPLTRSGPSRDGPRPLASSG